MPSVSTIVGNALPERVSFSKGHGATPMTCEAEYSGVVEVAMGTLVNYQVSGSLWSGKVVYVATRKNDSAGLMTIVRAIDLRDDLFSAVVFGRINMIDHDTGEVYTIEDATGDWSLQRTTTEYLYPKSLIEWLLEMCNFSAEYSPGALDILRSTAGDDWRNSRYNVFNLDWNCGTKVGAALTQICDALGLQFCMSTYLLGRTLRFSKIGEQEYNIEFEGVNAAEGSCGDAVQSDADTGVWIVGDRDIWEFTELPLAPAWNDKWNEIAWSATARQAFEDALDEKGQSLETIRVGDVAATLGEGWEDYFDDGFLDGRFFNDLTVHEYLLMIPFHVYRIQGMYKLLTADEFNGVKPVRCAPISFPLLSDPALQYSLECRVVTQHTKKHKKAIQVSLTKHLMEHGHHVSEKTGHVVFDLQQFQLKDSALEKINPTWGDIIPDVPTITVCFKGSMYREFFGTNERAGVRAVQGLCRHMLVEADPEITEPDLTLPIADYEKPLDGEKYADEFASDIATSILSKKRVVRSGEETFIGIAGHEPNGEISRVSVSVDSMQGIKETVSYANDEPEPGYDPQVELRRKILTDQQLRSLVKVRDDKKIESLRKLRAQFKTLQGGAQKDQETMAALEAFNRGNFMEVINTEELAYVAGEPLVAEPDGDGEFATLADADISDGDKRIAGIVIHDSDANRLRACTAGIANARVTGPVENGDALVLDNSADNYALKKGDGGPLVALAPVATGTTQVAPVRIGGGGGGGGNVTVKYASTSNVSPSGTTATTITFGTAPSIDGSTPAANDVVLLKNQSTGAQNGLYKVGAANVWTREGTLTAGMLVSVRNGTTNSGTVWELTTEAPITAGTTALIFSQIGKPASNVSVKVASIGTLTLSGAQTIDGISCVAGDVVLAKDQSTASSNGPYTVDSGAWVRFGTLTSGMLVSVRQGTNAGGVFTLVTEAPITPGSTSLSFRSRAFYA